MDKNEILSSMDAAAADIQRWVLQMAIKGRTSADRIRDIEHAAERIVSLNCKLAQVKE